MKICRLIWTVATGLVFSSTLSVFAKEEPDKGAQLFAQYCVSCHAQGGNRVKPSRPLAGSNKLVNSGVFAEYLTKPPGHMPYYESVVKNKQVLDSLYRYCKKLKKLPVREV